MKKVLPCTNYLSFDYSTMIIQYILVEFIILERQSTIYLIICNALIHWLEFATWPITIIHNSKIDLNRVNLIRRLLHFKLNCRSSMYHVHARLCYAGARRLSSVNKIKLNRNIGSDLTLFLVGANISRLMKNLVRGLESLPVVGVQVWTSGERRSLSIGTAPFWGHARAFLFFDCRDSV